MAKIHNGQLRGRKALIGGEVVEFDHEGIAEATDDQVAIVSTLANYTVHPVAEDPAADSTDETDQGEEGAQADGDAGDGEDETPTVDDRQGAPADEPESTSDQTSVSRTPVPNEEGPKTGRGSRSKKKASNGGK